MEHDGDLKTQIVEIFGADAYLSGQRLNRAYLSAILFKDQAKVQLINDLVHPVVQRDYVRWIKENRGHSYTVKEAALLFESGSYQQLDKIITVTAPRDIRIERILLRDANRTKQQVEEIMQSQWPENEKIEKSHFVINNDNSRLIIPQVLKIHEILTG
jgi:dephospho-CoA kinase